MRVKPILVFIGHQFFATWGVAIAAAILTFSFFEILRPLNSQFFVAHSASWLLTELHFYPVQMILALWTGWSLSLRLRHRSMLWVWVLPCLLLLSAMLVVPTLTRSQMSIINEASLDRSPLTHYLGSSCKVEERCADQLVITLPFYVSVCYSIGALLGRKGERHLESAGSVEAARDSTQDL